MTFEEPARPPYDLKERTYDFALHVRLHLSGQTWPPVSWTDVNQLLRSSGSVAANYVEAQEAISASDFLHRIRICRKETKESTLWLRLLLDTNDLGEAVGSEHRQLLKETDELARIFTAIILKKEKSL